MKTLVIGNDHKTSDSLLRCLQVAYPDAILESTASEMAALELIKTTEPDLIVIDDALINVDITGMVIQIRELSSAPLIVLTDKTTSQEKMRGWEAGVDDYFEKPFDATELLVRYKTMLRRTREAENTEFINVAGLQLNISRQEAYISGRKINLSSTEFRLLSELGKHKGKLVLHQTLLENVWGKGYDDSELLRAYIYRIRAKLKTDKNNDVTILSEHGLGYRLLAATSGTAK